MVDPRPMLLARLSGSVSDTWVAVLFSSSWARLCNSFFLAFSSAIFCLNSSALNRCLVESAPPASSYASPSSNSFKYPLTLFSISASSPFELCLAVIAALGVLRLDLGRINRYQFPAEKLQLAAQQDKLAPGRLDRPSVVAPEVRDGFEIRPQLAQQPDQFQVARRLPSSPRLEGTQLR